MRAHHSSKFLAGLATLLLVAPHTLVATPSAAAWEGSAGEDVLATSIDVLIVRPLASIRVLLGGLLMVPASLLASPGGKPAIEDAYQVLVEEPMEYAFEREIGDF